MNGRGHAITSLALGSTLVAMYWQGFINVGFETNQMFVAALFMSGVFMGASAPDWLELPIMRDGKVIARIIKHRTVTHWPPIWIGLAYWISLYELPWQFVIVAHGFILSALFHIAIDGLSYSGVPFLLPFSKYRVRFPLYRTGKFSEFVVISFMMSFFVGIVYFTMLFR